MVVIVKVMMIVMVIMRMMVTVMDKLSFLTAI
jgi:hypothetical protein